jgi:hypothetical protein
MMNKMMMTAVAAFALASLTACGSIDPQTAAFIAQNFQTAATANMMRFNSIPAYQPIPNAMPTTVPTYPPIVFQQLRAY